MKKKFMLLEFDHNCCFLNRPFHKLRHEQHLRRFRNNAMATNSQRIFLDMYSFHKSMIRGLKGDNHLGNRFKTRQVLFVT